MDPLSLTVSVAGLLSLTIQVTQVLYEQAHTLKNAPKDATKLLDELELLRQVLTRIEQPATSPLLKERLFKEGSVLVKAIQGCQAQIKSIKTRLEKIVLKHGISQIIERGRWYYEHDEHQQLIETLHRYVGIFQLSLSVDGVQVPFPIPSLSIANPRQLWLTKIRNSELLSKSIYDIGQEIRSIKGALSAMNFSTEASEVTSKQLDTITNLLIPLSQIPDDLNDMTNTIRRLDVKSQDEESQKIINWLSALNFRAKQQDVFSRKEPETWQWVFEEPVFQSWLHGTERILWCPGMPGAGKTILASSVINHLQALFPESNVGIAFIYCNYKEHNEQSLYNLLASIVQQLLQKRSVPDKLRDLYGRHSLEKTHLTLAECLNLLNQVVSDYSRVFIITDALDECDSRSRVADKLLDELFKLPSKASLMVTSRHIGSIEARLSQCLRLEIYARDSDMRIFLEQDMEKQERLQKHIHRDPSLRQAILDKVIQTADGMFLLAKLHMTALSQKHTPKAVRTALQSLPTRIDETYDDAMSRIRSQNEDDVDVAERVLSWITHAVAPLNILELRYAVSVEPDQESIDEDDLVDEDILVSVCGGLVVIDQKSEVVRLVHYTAQEYFDHKSPPHFPNGQTDITRSCLTYLSMEEVWGAIPMMEAYRDIEIQRFHTMLLQYPLLRYAAIFWGHHARGASEQGLEDQILSAFNCSSVLLVMNLTTLLTSRYSVPPHKGGAVEDIPGLWIAAMFGLTATCEILLKKASESVPPIDFARSDQFQESLTVSVEHGHESVVRLLLDRVTGSEEVPVMGSTLLLIGAEMGHESVINLLLEQGTKIEACNYAGETALHKAASKGYSSVVKLLLNKGADPNSKTLDTEETALQMAALQGHDTTVELLLEKGADTNAKTLDFRETALQMAASQDYSSTVNLLLNVSADPSAKTSKSRTPPYGVSDTAPTQPPLGKGAEIDATDRFGQTALFYACSNCCEDTAQLLIQSGADVNARSSNKGTALHLAGNENIAQLLFTSGADVNAQDQYGGTPLHAAAIGDGMSGVVQKLLDHGAAIDIKTNDGVTALQLAIRWQQGPTVMTLLENGASVEAAGKLGASRADIERLVKKWDESDSEDEGYPDGADDPLFR